MVLLVIRRAASSGFALLAAILAGLVVSATAAEPENGKFWRRPTICTQQYAPVCGTKNGVMKVYSIRCFAAAEGAKVIATGTCR